MGFVLVPLGTKEDKKYPTTKPRPSGTGGDFHQAQKVFLRLYRSDQSCVSVYTGRTDVLTRSYVITYTGQTDVLTGSCYCADTGRADWC